MSQAPAALSTVLKDVFDDFLIVVGTDVKIFGPVDHAANAAPPGVWWEPGAEVWTPGQRLGGPGSPSALWTREVPVAFLIFGGLPEETYSDEEAPLHEGDQTEYLLAAFVNAFHRRVSQHGYRITGGQWVAGGRDTIGLAYELAVQVRLPLVREDNQVVTLEGITETIEIGDE